MEAVVTHKLQREIWYKFSGLCVGVASLVLFILVASNS